MQMLSLRSTHLHRLHQSLRVSLRCLGVFGTVFSVGCSLLDNPTIPDGTMSPTMYHSKAGGLGLSTYATDLFRIGMIGSVLDGGLLTDELNKDFKAEEPIGKGMDERFLPEVQTGFLVVGQYATLQKLRGQAMMARAVLARYGSDLSPAVRGRLLALEGYAVMLLADQYCAGVTLSTLDFEGDYTYKPPLTIAETYEQAVILFDSALAISSDSTGVITLATVGKARALVGAGRLADAYAVARPVLTSDAYRIRASFITGYNDNEFVKRASVSDREGWNGLPYRTSGDPRSVSDTATMRVKVGTDPTTFFLIFPRKYATGDSFSFVVAGGIEARLIEAEYQLSKGNVPEWLSLLNTLRTNGTFSQIDTLDDETVDTVWNAGTGGVDRLARLNDPGSPDARISLLFEERAYWLFLTGQRLPDLRRLVRQYSRDREQVFPTGIYVFGTSTYGEYQSSINMPIPGDERRNPLFHGCTNRDQ